MRHLVSENSGINVSGRVWLLGIGVCAFLLLLCVQGTAQSPANAPASKPVSVTVVAGGESVRTAADCRGVVVGPGVNQPDPFPGYRGFVGWDTPLRLRNGSWLVGFNAGYWHASGPTPHRYSPQTLEQFIKMGMPADVDAPTGGRAMLTRSTDEGRTWSKPETLIDTPADDRHPSLIELPSGTILCSFFTYTGAEDFKAAPALAYRTHVIRSVDGGKTWQAEAKPLPSPFIADEADGPMVLAKDGSVLLAINGKPVSGGPDQLALLRSKDEGGSWELVSTVSTDHELSEASVAELPSGRLVLVARPEGDICWSDDKGLTWTKPTPFGIRLFAPSLYVAKDGTLIWLHGSYGAGGLRVIFSVDGGQTWVAPATDHGFLVDTAYGYGKATELPDGTFFITYISTGGHASEDARGNAVWCIRLRVRPDHSGIDLLPAVNP